MGRTKSKAAASAKVVRGSAAEVVKKPARVTGAAAGRQRKAAEPAGTAEIATAPIAPPAPAKRLKRFRKKCPVAIDERAERVMSQRMVGDPAIALTQFMIQREAGESGEMGDYEVFQVLGSTGNVYTVNIGPVPSCDCPDWMKGNSPCKHIIFVFLKIFKVPRASGTWYQRHILPEELAAVYKAAPAGVSKAVSVPSAVRAAFRAVMGHEAEPEPADDAGEGSSGVAPGEKRLSALGDDCPICFEAMTVADHEGGVLVFDLGIGGCGKPLHAECFAAWEGSERAKGCAVTCVWCRSVWAVRAEPGDPSAVGVSRLGYMNLASAMGMSRTRDTSWGPFRGVKMRDLEAHLAERYAGD